MATGKWTVEQIPSQAGKTVLVTGANSGIGYQAALELARDRIRVNCVHPGMTDTPMMDRIHQGSGAPEQMAAAISATIPMRRYACADEVAALMLFLASEESSYCTGASYAVDGGTLASWQSTPE